MPPRTLGREWGELAFGQRQISFSIIRSHRRHTLAITVDSDGGVTVRAPHRLPPERIRSVVRQKATWIVQRQAERHGSGSVRSPREFVNGEGFPYLGRNYRLRIETQAECGTATASLLGGYLVVRLPKAKSIRDPARRDMVRRTAVAWYRRQARGKLGERVAFYAERLGVDVPQVLIRSQLRRWGSCSVRGVLRLNWRVIMMPLAQADYVVVHELCHLRARDHSRTFWRLVGSLLPDYESRRERLRVQGADVVL